MKERAAGLAPAVFRATRNAWTSPAARPARVRWRTDAMVRRLALLLVLAPAAHAEPPADALPPGAVARLRGRPFTPDRGRDTAIQALVFTPDGKTVVTATNDQKAVLWDTA